MRTTSSIGAGQNSTAAPEGIQGVSLLSSQGSMVQETLPLGPATQFRRFPSRKDGHPQAIPPAVMKTNDGAVGLPAVGTNTKAIARHVHHDEPKPASASALQGLAQPMFAYQEWR